MKGRPVAAISVVVMLAATLAAEPMRVDVKNVPVDRVVANLEQQVRERPADVDLRVNLARVHAMAYAQKRTTIPTATYPLGRPGVTVPWVDYLAPDFQQFRIRTSNDPKVMAAAREHLTKAIARYREALELAPTHPVAQMGLGWTLSQSGDKVAAIQVLRNLVAQMQADPKGGPLVFYGFRTLIEEAVLYLVPLLDPERDPAEIDRLKALAAKMARQGRPITPIAVPLADHAGALDIVNPDASVAFDLDGSALPQRWTWIRPSAAWLVFDNQGTGSITSGLQLFGNVTFWLFWRNGYDALRSLDDDGDGRIADAEIAGLALWHDRNADGVSDRGEVRPVSEWGIVSLSCEYRHDPTHPDEIAMSPRGVMFRDGRTRPTFDLLLQPASR